MHVCRYMCIICLFRCQVFSVTRHCIPERRFLTDPGTQPSSQQSRELALHPPLRSTYKLTGFLCGFWGFELRSSCPHNKCAQLLDHLPINTQCCFCFVLECFSEIKTGTCKPLYLHTFQESTCSIYPASKPLWLRRPTWVFNPNKRWDPVRSALLLPFVPWYLLQHLYFGNIQGSGRLYLISYA